MKSRGYIIAALAIIVVALVIHRAVESLPSKTSPELNPSGSQTGRDFNTGTNLPSRADRLETTGDPFTGNPARTVEVWVSTSNDLRNGMMSGLTGPEATRQTPDAAGKLAVAGSNDSLLPPVTPVLPPPFELGRTNTPEIPPGTSRSFSSP